MSLPKERPQFADRYLEKAYRLNVGKFPRFIDDKIAELDVFTRQGKSRVIRLPEERLNLYYQILNRGGNDERVFTIDEDYGQVDFQFTKEGSGIKRTIISARPEYPISDQTVTSRMMSAEEVAELTTIMAAPGILYQKHYPKIMDINGHELGLLTRRGINLSLNGRTA